MKHSFWLVALPLYVAWFCVGRLSASSPSYSARPRLVYLGALLGTAGVLLPIPWLALCWQLPTSSPGVVALWIVLVLSGILHLLVRTSGRRYSVPELRRGLLWTADISVLGWLLYGWG